MTIRLVTAASLSLALLSPQPGDRVTIRVDANARRGPMTQMWAFFGYDEPNFTYTANGNKLLSELSALSPVPVFVRTHNLLTTGDGSASMKWGSTNAYTVDPSGRPVYDWTIVDRIFDTYVSRRMKPLVEIGFMPEALSAKPQPYRHDWRPGLDYNRIYTGWSYPPKDYDQWRELITRWVAHCVEKYGQREVESWYWEVWNEPDIGYWHGTPEEYQKLYDYAADGLKRALPTARIGGPHVTGPNGPRTQGILQAFLEHCLRGTNYATGKIGSPLDYIGFHAKGAPRFIAGSPGEAGTGHVRMGVSNQLRAIANGFRIVSSFPELRDTPIILGESDPEGCAACGVQTNPENAYRNGTVYSSYTAEQIARTYELADTYKVNLRGSVTWAFEFEDQPYFAGFRDLATNGIDKPVLNIFRLLGRMLGDRVVVESSGALPLDAVRDTGVRDRPDINALASRSERTVSILIWNYHDDDVPALPADVELLVDGIAARSVEITHDRVDATHSNAYEAWRRMGSPQPPSKTQYTQLERAGRLQALERSRRVKAENGRVRLAFTLPRQAVSLVRVTW
jgi:xylan 1,4-beta-xylosidase